MARAKWTRDQWNVVKAAGVLILLPFIVYVLNIPSTPATALPITSTSPVQPSNMPPAPTAAELAKRRTRAEQTLAATSIAGLARLSDSAINWLTDQIPRATSDPKGQSLWTEFYKRQQRSWAAQTKQEAQRRLQTVLNAATCKPSRARVSSLLAKHGDWDDDDLALIACRQVLIGMKAEQVAAAWGRPQDINRTVGAFGVHEQWVWEDPEGLPSHYAYMDDGILTTLQD